MAAALQLDYIFTPSPYPIRTSETGANANTIDVHVIISNPSRFDAVTMKEIQIAFPVGDDIAADLAVSAVLHLTYDTSGPWSITTGAKGSPDGTVTVKPATGSARDITTEAIEFTIVGIVVNEQPGTVLVKITETTPPARSVTDSSTYRLKKLDADFPVTSFTAEPTVIYDLDTPVNLSWSVSDEGQGYRYGLRIAGVGQPGDGALYTWKQGQPPGQPVGRISKATTFELDVVAPKPSGKTFEPLHTTVRALIPKISTHSYFAPSPTGHLVSGHWKVTNASACTVVVDRMTIDDAAPPDTYASGYLITIADEPTTRHDVTVTVPRTLGKAGDSFTCQPSITINAPKTIPAGQFPGAIAFNPQGTLALVANQTSANVTVVDRSNLAAEKAMIGTGQCPVAIATTPDGSLALTADLYSDSVSFIDIAKRAVVGAVSVPQPTGVAVTPDGKWLFVTDQLNNRVIVIDVAARVIDGAPILTDKSSIWIAITPDGSRALTADIDVGTVTVIDVVSRQVTGTISVGTVPQQLAISPDGSIALVANEISNSVSLIDLSTLSVVATLESSPSPVSVAISPDGRRALVCNFGGNDGGGIVTAIDLPNRTCTPMHLERQGDPPVINVACGVAFAPDGSFALVSDGRSNQIVVL